MREPTAHKLEELVKNHAPPNAAGYCFQRTTNENEVLRYPTSGCWKLNPFQMPFGVPNGFYIVFFFRTLEDRQPLSPRSVLDPYPEVPFFMPVSGANSAAAARESSSAQAAKDETGSTALAVPSSAQDIRRMKAELHAEMERMPAVRETRLEYLQRQLALELQEQNQDLLKYGHYVAEVGGQFQLNRAYRMESQQAMETVLGLAKRTAEDAQTMMSLFRGMQEMQIEALAAIKKQVAVLASPPPPPPPPDYTGTATAAVNLIRDVSVALIQLKSPPGSRPPELPASNRGEVHTAEIQGKPDAAGASLSASASVPPVHQAAPATAQTQAAQPSTPIPAPPPPVLAQETGTAATPAAPPPIAVPQAAQTALSAPPSQPPVDPQAPVAPMASPAMAPAVPPSPLAPEPAPASEAPAMPASHAPAQGTAPAVAAAEPASGVPLSASVENAPPPAAEPSVTLAEKLIATAIECQRLDEKAEAGEPIDTPPPQVSPPKVEPPRSPLVDASPPALTTAAPEPRNLPSSAPPHPAPEAGWLGVLRFMFAGQKSALEKGLSALRGRRKP